MRKVAIFVEGYTEIVFTEKLLREIFGENKIRFIITKKGESIKENKYNVIDGERFVFLHDCQGDSAVKSSIIEHRDALKRANFDSVIGLRDVYPLAHCNITKLKNNLYYGMPQGGLPVYIQLAVMEIESIFLWESTHLIKMFPANQAGVDVAVSDLIASHYHDWPHPAEKLDQVYKTLGSTYIKRRNAISKSINALDFSRIYLECGVGWIKEYIKTLEDALL